MSREEEDEVHSVGSMPVLTVRSEVEDSDESSGESRSWGGSCKSEKIKKDSEGDQDGGSGAIWEGLDPIMDTWIVIWSNDFTPSTKNVS